VDTINTLKLKPKCDQSISEEELIPYAAW